MFLGGFSLPLTVIQTVNLNSKFRRFLVRILVRKDNTDNKNFQRNLIQRNKKENYRKDKVFQIFRTICRKLIWDRESGKQSSLNLSLFLYFFCFIEKFQTSLNFEFSLRFFSEEFSLEFSFS